MWRGYLDEPRGARLRAFLDRHHVPLHTCHTSGHATVTDLARLVRTVAPSRLVPIHTFGADRYAEFFPAAPVERFEDGAWWTC